MAARERKTRSRRRLGSRRGATGGNKGHVPEDNPIGALEDESEDREVCCFRVFYQILADSTRFIEARDVKMAMFKRISRHQIFLIFLEKI